MPSSKNEKRCEVCFGPLVLKNKKDEVRKRFCSESCRSRAAFSDREFGSKICDVCGREFKATNRFQKRCGSGCAKSLQVERSYKYLHNNPKKYFQHALYKKGREALSVEFMMNLLESQEGKCAISGQKLTFCKIQGNGRVNTNASIDQKIAGGGYTEDNVQLVCSIVNVMKNDMTPDELLFWSNAIVKESKNS